LAYQSGFGPAYLQSLLRLEKATANPNTYFGRAVDWLDSLIGPGGLLLVISHQFAVPILVLWAGLEKSKQTKV